jgi:hypothetical protein
MARRHAELIAGFWLTDGVHKWMAYDRLTGDLIGRGGLSRVQLAAVKPYGLSFIKRIASSSLETGMMPTTGPNVSSLMMRIP